MKNQTDLGLRQRHHYTFRNGTMDFAAGWILGYSDLGGLSVGEVFDCLNSIRDGDPQSWADEFSRCAARQKAWALEAMALGDTRGAGMKYLAASVAARAALHLMPPESSPAKSAVETMESSFQAAMVHLNRGLDPVLIPTSSGSLPGYRSHKSAAGTDVYVVIGGGDTFREDLYFFGGSAALDHGYHVVLVDLPGQGTTPYQGQHFGRATVECLQEVLRWLRDDPDTGRIVLTGYSGGGYFTAKALAGAPVDAWVASTPVFDLKRLIEVAMPALVRDHPDGWAARALLGLAGRVNPVMAAALAKYRWQFGPRGFADLLDSLRDLGPVDLGSVNVPGLFLVGLSEDAEGLRQAQVWFDQLSPRQPATRLITFGPETGADAHCQVNNLRWTQHQIFAWLDRVSSQGLAS